MKQVKFPLDWDDATVRRVLEYYENQAKEDALLEDEAAIEPKVRELIARQEH